MTVTTPTADEDTLMQGRERAFLHAFHNIINNNGTTTTTSSGAARLTHSSNSKPNEQQRGIAFGHPHHEYEYHYPRHRDLLQELIVDHGLGNVLMPFLRVGDIQLLLCVHSHEGSPVRHWILKRNKTEVLPFQNNRMRYPTHPRHYRPATTTTTTTTTTDGMLQTGTTSQRISTHQNTTTHHRNTSSSTSERRSNNSNSNNDNRTNYNYRRDTVSSANRRRGKRSVRRTRRTS